MLPNPQETANSAYSLIMNYWKKSALKSIHIKFSLSAISKTFSHGNHIWSLVGQRELLQFLYLFVTEL